MATKTKNITTYQEHLRTQYGERGTKKRPEQDVMGVRPCGKRHLEFRPHSFERCGISFAPENLNIHHIIDRIQLEMILDDVGDLFLRWMARLFHVVRGI